MKTLYLCKCGKSFYKSSDSSTTGYRMPDYGPDHECYGCPFVCNVTSWDSATHKVSVYNHECRTSKHVRYDSYASLSLKDKCVGRIYSLDFDFLHQIRDFADSLSGIEPDRYAFSSRPSDYGSDGRYMLTIYPTQNKSGIQAKQTLFDRFFNRDGSRKDLSPEQEKDKILAVIDESKKEARQLNTYYAPCGQKFNRSAGRVSEVTIEVTGTTATCFCCPHATHEPGDDRQGPKTFCLCTRRQAADSNRENKTETEEKEIKHMGKLNLANISAGLNQVKPIAESLANVSHYELIPLEYIRPAEHNAYAENDSDESRYVVAMSIQANGLLEPLVVNKKAEDCFTLIAGEHRFTAIKQYLPEQFKKISCMVFEGLTDDEAQLKLHEANRQREYTPEQKFKHYLELNELLHRMKNSGNYHGPIQKGIAELIGVSTRQIRKYQTITEKLSPDQQQAVIRGEVSINEACQSISSDSHPEDKSGTISIYTIPVNPAESQKTTKEDFEKEHPVEIDHGYWDGKILAALKYHYDPKEIYAYYLFQVPTTMEAIKEKLKPAYGYSGGSVKFSDQIWGDCTARSQKITIKYGKQTIDLTYAQVDDIIRKAIRKGAWVSADTAETIVLDNFTIAE